MFVGIDFDNTIVCYDEVMHAAALEMGHIDPGCCVNKKMIRDAIRRLPDGENRWRGLQVAAYGTKMAQAVPFPGVREFFARCRDLGVPTAVVSHKTRYPNFGASRVDLRKASLRWLERNGFFGPEGLGLDPDRVFFESTRADKISRIARLGLSHFIDDLEEVFADPAFPPDIARLLFAPGGAQAMAGVETFGDWAALGLRLLGGKASGESHVR